MNSHPELIKPLIRGIHCLGVTKPLLSGIPTIDEDGNTGRTWRAVCKHRYGKVKGEYTHEDTLVGTGDTKEAALKHLLKLVKRNRARTKSILGRIRSALAA